jgi:hypothetical protein
VDVVDACLPTAERISKSFDSDVSPDLVAVFEAVGHGLCHAVNVDLHSLDLVLFGSFNEGAAGEPYHAKCWRLDGRFASFEVDRNPHLVWILGGQSMKAKG